MTELPEVQDLLLEQHQSALFVTLNRPQTKNAITAAMVDGLMQLCDWLVSAANIRAVVLRGAGGAFCAGGDIKEFAAQMMAPAPEEGAQDPVAKANRVFGDLLLKLGAIPQTLIVAVEGPAFGGANGFIAVADIAIADASAKLSLSETTLGVVPAQIAPFLVAKIGAFNARRLALTGAHFSAEEAARIGHVDRVVNGPGAIDTAIIDALNSVGRCAPGANALTKKLINDCTALIDPLLLDRAANDFAASLRSEGKAGAGAFLAKSPPPWVETYTEKKET